MKILYLHQYFNTSQGINGRIPGFRSYEFGRRFVEVGHEVEVITSLTTPADKAGSRWRVTNESGMRVNWFRSSYSNKMSFWPRVRAFLHFAIAASRRATRTGSDVVYATSTPLTIAIPALYACWRSNRPLVFEVRDLWPEAPRQMGFLKNPVLYWLAKQLELAAYRKATHIIALSPGMKEGIIATGQPAAKITVIPNASDLDLFHPAVDGSPLRAALGLEDKVVFLYCGTMGPANGLDFVIDVAEVLQVRGNRKVTFLLVGDGKERRRLVERAAARKLANVVFHDAIPERTRVAEAFAAADVCLTIFANVPVLYTCSPNKMFDAFSAGRPVLTNMPGWLTDLVEQNGCGLAVRPDDVDDFADKVEILAGDSELRVRMGEKARELAQREFSRDDLARQALEVLKNAVHICTVGEDTVEVGAVELPERQNRTLRYRKPDPARTSPF